MGKLGDNIRHLMELRRQQDELYKQLLFFDACLDAGLSKEDVSGETRQVEFLIPEYYVTTTAMKPEGGAERVRKDPINWTRRGWGELGAVQHNWHDTGRIGGVLLKDGRRVKFAVPVERWKKG